MLLRWLCPRKTDESRRSDEIDREIQLKHKEFERSIKILLLGTAESGKTTVLKQMKILHINGFSDEERKEKIPEIIGNIHESICVLIKQLKIFNIEYEIEKNKLNSEYIINLCENFNGPLTNEYIDNILNIWNDIGIRTCLKRSNEFQLPDSTKYFLDNFERISKINYIPTTEDILHSRKITKDITEIKFKVKVPAIMGGGYQEFRMFDVGGQRDQRTKWIQVFEGIQAVLFIISLGDFDQTLKEDNTQNRLLEAIQLFRRVWHNRFLSNSGIIVFLNKQDIMEYKIHLNKSIGDYFNDYNEFKNTYSPSRLEPGKNYFNECDWTKYYIKQRLVNITMEPVKKLSRISPPEYLPRECYFHFTVATDTNNIRKVFYDVHNMILRDNLNSIGLI